MAETMVAEFKRLPQRAYISGYIPAVLGLGHISNSRHFRLDENPCGITRRTRLIVHGSRLSPAGSGLSYLAHRVVPTLPPLLLVALPPRVN